MDLTINNRQQLICHKSKPNQTNGHGPVMNTNKMTGNYVDSMRYYEV